MNPLVRDRGAVGARGSTFFQRAVAYASLDFEAVGETAMKRRQGDAVASQVPADPGEVNRAAYHKKGVDRLYDATTLWPAEIAALLKYQSAFAGKEVLDLGVGTGRTTRYLEPLVARYVGVDYSQVMVDKARAKWPGLDLRHQDMRDLSPFPGQSFDFVLASVNLVDAVSHNDRLTVFREVHRVLRADGIFMSMSHNRNYRHALRGPRLRYSRNPVTQLVHIANYLKRLANHAGMRKLFWFEEEYALLDDDEGSQHAQAKHLGFDVLDTFDGAGNSLAENDSDEGDLSLLYVLRKDGAVSEGDL